MDTDDEVHLISRLFDHIYTVKYYPAKLDGEDSFISTLYTDIKMYQIADKYVMADLKEEARLKLQYHVNQLRGHPGQFLAIYELIPMIYEKSLSDDMGIRDIVTELGVVHMDMFRALREFDGNTLCIEYSNEHTDTTIILSAHHNLGWQCIPHSR